MPRCVHAAALIVSALFGGGCHLVGGLDDYERGEIVCHDGDADGYGEGCSRGPDCDDTLGVCNTDCADADGDGIADCNSCMDNPRLVGTLDTEGSVQDVALQGNYAYLADFDGGMVIADVSNPTAPVLVGSLPPPATVYDGSITAVEVFESRAYLSARHEGLQIVDVTNPASLAYIGCGACNDAYGDTGWGIQIVWPLAYFADVSSMRIFDVTDPTSLVQFGSQQFGTYAYPKVEDVVSVMVSGSYAYLGCKTGLQVVDVSDPSATQLVGSFDSSFVREVFVREPLLYAANDANLYILDISEPSSPTQIGFIDTFGGATGVFVAGGYAYVGESGGGKLVIVDVSSPENAQELGSVYTGVARTAVMRDGYVFVAGGDRGLRVVSVLCEQPAP